MDVDNNQQLPERVTRSGSESGVNEVLQADSLVRRRALFKGLGKGGAVLAATVPIHTLAGQTLLTAGGAHQCSVSGMHSGVHSATTNVAECGGYSPGWWGQTDVVSGKCVPRRVWPTLPSSWTYKTSCKTVFSRFTGTNPAGSSGTNINPLVTSLFDVMSPQAGGDFSNTDEFHWICAWLNALSHSFNFPYSGQQVIDYYNANDQDALSFFKTYMEQHTS